MHNPSLVIQLCNGLFLLMLFAQTVFCYCYDATTQGNSRSFCAKFKFGLLVVKPKYALPLDFRALP